METSGLSPSLARKIEESNRTNGEFTLLTLKDLENFPEMDWLVDDVLPSSGLGCVYGPSGSGKSFICLDMAASVAAGIDWFGRRVKQCPVVYVVLEGQAGFRNRARAWEISRGVPFPSSVRFVFDRYSIRKTGDSELLGQLINDCLGAGLIIVDTLNKAAAGADENSSAEMGKIIAGASILQEQTGAFVLLVHHPGKDTSRGMRGHSSLYAALDTVIAVEPHGDNYTWTLDKSKDGQDGFGQGYKLRTIELGSSDIGKSVTSCFIEQVDGIISPGKSHAPTGKNQKAILAKITEMIQGDRMLAAYQGDDWPAGIYMDECLNALRNVLSDVDSKHRLQRAREAIDSLIKQGHLLINEEELLSLP